MDAKIERSNIPFVISSLAELEARAAKESDPELEKAIADRYAAGIDKIKFGRHMTGSQLERAMTAATEV